MTTDIMIAFAKGAGIAFFSALGASTAAYELTSKWQTAIVVGLSTLAANALAQLVPAGIAARVQTVTATAKTGG